MSLDDYLRLTPEEQSAVNSDLEAAGKFAEWGTANPLAPECLTYTTEGYGPSDLAEMGFGPKECPNE